MLSFWQVKAEAENGPEHRAKLCEDRSQASNAEMTKDQHFRIRNL